MTFPATPLDLRTEIKLDGVWTDISDYVFTRGAVTVTRGRADEEAKASPAAAKLIINNVDGRFSPRNPTSPYYGVLGRNTPLRLSVPASGGGRDYRFYGEVSSWPTRWDVSGTDVLVGIEASGITRRLGQGSSPLRSTMYREHTNPTRTNIVAYWPAEDAEGSAALASGLPGGAAMTITGTPTLASYEGWLASDKIPAMGDAKFTGPVTMTATGELAVRSFVFVSDPVAAETSLIHLSTVGTAVEWEVLLDASGNLRTRAYDGTGASLLNSFVSFGMNSLGFTVVALELVQNGANVNWATKVLDFAATTTVDGTIPLTQATGTVTGQTFGRATRLTVGKDRGLNGVIAGHFGVADDTGAFLNTTGALAAQQGERPSTRFARLCDEEGIPNTVQDTNETGNTVRMGAQRLKTLPDLLAEVADTDGGIVYEPRDSLGLAYRTRTDLYNQTAALALDYAAGHVAPELEPVDDDQATRNDITVTRDGGSSARAEQTTGALSTAAPPDGVGRYDTSATISVVTDAQLPDQAGWRLHLGTVDETRYPTIAVWLHAPDIVADAALGAAALAVDIGDRITIDNPPPWLPPDQITQLVQGYVETFEPKRHILEFNCTPEEPYHIATPDTGTYLRADTAGSQLAAAATSSATSLSVATTLGPLWTTAAGDMPFDITIGGERITVTAVSGSSSPQTFTVTRSANGVVKAHSNGDAVALASPAYVGL